MTEAREQFWDRLAQILDAKFAEAFRTPEERASWDMVRPEWKQAMSDMAEAVAVQVLRDVLDEIGADTPAGYLVTRLADDNGINLED